MHAVVCDKKGSFKGYTVMNRSNMQNRYNTSIKEVMGLNAQGPTMGRDWLSKIQPYGGDPELDEFFFCQEGQDFKYYLPNTPRDKERKYYPYMNGKKQYDGNPYELDQFLAWAKNQVVCRPSMPYACLLYTSPSPRD